MNLITFKKVTLFQNMEFLVTFSGKIPALSSVFGTQSFTINFCFYLNPSVPADQLIQLWLLFLAHGTHLISQHFKRAFLTQSSLCSRFLLFVLGFGFTLPIAPMVFHHTFETFFLSFNFRFWCFHRIFPVTSMLTFLKPFYFCLVLSLLLLQNTFCSTIPGSFKTFLNYPCTFVFPWYLSKLFCYLPV